MTYEPDPLVAPVVAGQPVVNGVVNRAVVDAAVVERPVAAVATPTVISTAPAVERVVVEQPAVHRTVATTYGQRLAFDSFVVGVIGVALTILGLVAATRAGFESPMNEPVVDVMGFTHTATLGAIETGFGVCLLICAALTARGAAALFGEGAFSSASAQRIRGRRAPAQPVKKII